MPMNKSKLRSIIYYNWPKDLDKKIDNKSAPALLQKLIERCKSFMLTHKSPKQVILERCAEITKADLNEYIDYIVFVLEMCQYNYKGKGKIPSDCSGKRDTDDDLYWFALIDSIKISKLSYKCVLIDEV